MSNNNEQNAVQRSIDNNADIYSTIQSVVVNHAKSRPTNTTITYEERKSSKKKQKTSNGTMVPLGKESILAYVKAMTDLYQSQVALRLNNNPHPCGNAIRALIDTLSRDEIKRKKRTI